MLFDICGHGLGCTKLFTSNSSKKKSRHFESQRVRLRNMVRRLNVCVYVCVYGDDASSAREVGPCDFVRVRLSYGIFAEKHCLQQ